MAAAVAYDKHTRFLIWLTKFFLKFNWGVKA